MDRIQGRATLRKLKTRRRAFPGTVPQAEQLPAPGALGGASAEATARPCDTRRNGLQARQNCSHELKIQAVMIGGEGGIRTHVPELPDHPISSRRRYDHFGTSPAEQFRADVCQRRVRPPHFAGWYSSGSWSREGRFAKD